jgi:hypothetical protein
MVQARDAVGRRSWSHPQEPTTEDWWADVLADPRSRRPTTRFRDLADRRPFYRLSDEARATILVACSKCEWRGAFQRDELIAAHGADYPLPDLLDQLAAPDCARLGSFWDRCGVYYLSRSRGWTTDPTRGRADAAHHTPDRAVVSTLEIGQPDDIPLAFEAGVQGPRGSSLCLCRPACKQ